MYIEEDTLNEDSRNETITWMIKFITEWNDATDAVCGWRKKFAKAWTRETRELGPKLAKRRAALAADD